MMECFLFFIKNHDVFFLKNTHTHTQIYIHTHTHKNTKKMNKFFFSGGGALNQRGELTQKMTSSEGVELFGGVLLTETCTYSVIYGIYSFWS